MTSVRSPMVQVGVQEPLMEEKCDENPKSQRDSVSDVTLTHQDHLEKTEEPPTRIQMISQDVNRRNLREVEAVMDQLRGLSVSELQGTTQTDENETKESLMQHIQVSRRFYCGYNILRSREMFDNC